MSARLSLVLLAALAARAAADPPRPAFDANAAWSGGRAAGRGPVRFTHAPLRPDAIDRILPYGLMVGGHVTPIDHQYYFPKPLPPGGKHYPVVAPADGHVVQIAHRVQLAGSTEKRRDYDDYQLIVEHTGTFYTHYDLLTALDETLLAGLDAATRRRFAQKQQGPPVHVRVPVKAGQALGTVGGRSLDFGVVNTEVTLPGFLTPALYGHYAWRVHTVDPFDHFAEPLKSRLLKLNPRTAAPRGGKIDFDVAGRAVGNWFKAGTNGYPGTRDPRGYWIGHLALVYHAIDPDRVIVSVGDFDGRPRQFAAVGNGPDPGKVTADDGVVKYELVYDDLDSAGRRVELPDRGVQGVLLVQLLGDRKLKVEAFPGQAARDVRGFTAAAAVYER